MTDAEANVKIAFLVVGIGAVIFIGYFMVFVMVPVFIVASVIDFGMRQAYDKKLAQVRGQGNLVEAPNIQSFEARLVDGEVLIAWIANLPGDAMLDVYRLVDHGGGTIEDIQARGPCILSTDRELTHSRDDLFVDVGLAEGVYYYVPVVSGLVIEIEPLPYHFPDFVREVQYRTRRNRRQMRGEAVSVVVAEEVVEQLPDLRDAPTRIADDVMAHIQSRRKFDADLDAAIARIKSTDDLSEDEKQEAIELLETRATAI